MFTGKLPDITPAQIIAFVTGAIGPLCLLIGIDLSAEQKGAIDELRDLAIGLFAADAAIRIGRNLGVGRKDTMPDEPGHAEPVA